MLFHTSESPQSCLIFETTDSPGAFLLYTDMTKDPVELIELDFEEKHAYCFNGLHHFSISSGHSRNWIGNVYITTENDDLDPTIRCIENCDCNCDDNDCGGHCFREPVLNLGIDNNHRIPVWGDTRCGFSDKCTFQIIWTEYQTTTGWTTSIDGKINALLNYIIISYYITLY